MLLFLEVDSPLWGRAHLSTSHQAASASSPALSRCSGPTSVARRGPIRRKHPWPADLVGWTGDCDCASFFILAAFAGWWATDTIGCTGSTCRAGFDSGRCDGRFVGARLSFEGLVALALEVWKCDDDDDDEGHDHVLRCAALQGSRLLCEVVQARPRRAGDISRAPAAYAGERRGTVHISQAATVVVGSQTAATKSEKRRAGFMPCSGDETKRNIPKTDEVAQASGRQVDLGFLLGRSRVVRVPPAWFTHRCVMPSPWGDTMVLVVC